MEQIIVIVQLFFSLPCFICLTFSKNPTAGKILTWWWHHYVNRTSYTCRLDKGLKLWTTCYVRQSNLNSCWRAPCKLNDGYSRRYEYLFHLRVIKSAQDRRKKKSVYLSYIHTRPYSNIKKYHKKYCHASQFHYNWQNFTYCLLTLHFRRPVFVPNLLTHSYSTFWHFSNNSSMVPIIVLRAQARQGLQRGRAPKRFLQAEVCLFPNSISWPEK